MPGSGGAGSVKQMSEVQGPAGDDAALGRVIGNLAAGVVILQDDRIAYVNGRAARMLGREVAALVGTDPASLLSGDERGRPGETLAAIIEGRIEEDYTEYRLVLP